MLWMFKSSFFKRRRYRYDTYPTNYGVFVLFLSIFDSESVPPRDDQIKRRYLPTGTMKASISEPDQKSPWSEIHLTWGVGNDNLKIIIPPMVGEFRLGIQSCTDI